MAVSQSSPERAVAETTGGTSEQHHGTAHNPFTPLPQAKTATASKAASASTSAPASASAGSSSTSTGSSTPSTPSTGSSAPTTSSKPSTTAKPKTVYHVAVLFGALPAAGATATPLTPYENLKLLTPLPSATQPLIVFSGVTVGGKSATFTLVSEAILHGDGSCLPSASQCQAIDLKPGQTEQLEYVSAAGQPTSYELRIVSIVSSKASGAAVKSLLRGESKAGRELLSHAGLVAVPDLRYSSQAGVLVFAGHPAFGGRSSIARAHSSARRRHSR